LVGTRELGAVDTLLTAGLGKSITTVLLSDHTARAREVSLATVRRIKIVVSPTSLADKLAETSRRVAKVLSRTTRILSSINMVDISESVNGTRTTIRRERYILVLFIDVSWTERRTVEELGRVKERAVESSGILSNNTGNVRGNAEILADVIDSVQVGEERGNILNIERLLAIAGHVTGQSEVEVKPGSRNGEFKSRGARIASISRTKREVG